VHPQPPRRTTHAYGTPKNRLVYDRWGRFGRPVVLLHGLFYDRTMWWPVAAELGDSCAAIAVDLPGHGDSAARDDYDVTQLAEDLAVLINGLALHRAPVIVGHAESARLAETFAAAYATQAVLTFQDTPAEPPETAQELEMGDLSGVPELYRQFAVARHDDALLAGYRSWFSPPAHSEPRPETMPLRLSAEGSAQARLGGRFPHLCDAASFAALLRTLR
jgi:pimeloyl-ACP methyl ester carboxylesterase